MESRQIHWLFVFDEVPKVKLDLDNGFELLIPIGVLQEIVKRYEDYAEGQDKERAENKKAHHKMVKTLDGVVYNKEDDF